jgi:hypothetical protein
MITEIKRSMMRIYSDSDDERYVLIEAEHKEDIETGTKRGRDGILWDAWDAVSDNVKEEIDKLSGEEKFNAICRAIDPERKLFQYVKWVKPTFDTDTFIFFNVRNGVKIDVDILYAEEAVLHCARCYEPEGIDIERYIWGVIVSQIECRVEELGDDFNSEWLLKELECDNLDLNETGLTILDLRVN